MPTARPIPRSPGSTSRGARRSSAPFPFSRLRGKSFAFHSVFRDFAYLPPANVVKVFALESSDLGLSENPRTIDAVASALKKAGLQVLPINAKLAAEDFRGAYSGEAEALASLGLDASTPYAAFVLVEVAQARQVELNGKKYNIFTASATLNFRLVRSDGSIVFSLPIDGIKGQGATEEAAVADAYRRAGESVGAALQKKFDSLKSRDNEGVGRPSTPPRLAVLVTRPSPVLAANRSASLASPSPVPCARSRRRLPRPCARARHCRRTVRPGAPDSPPSRSAKQRPSRRISVLPSQARSKMARASLKASEEER